MRKLITYLVASIMPLCFALIPSTVKASHAAGAEINYEYVTGSTYRVYYKFYRDCSGFPPAPDSVQLCYINSCNPNDVYSVWMQKYTGLIPPGVPIGTPVSLGCAVGTKTVCEGGTLPGYTEWWYTAIVTLPYQCNYWTFSASISARNTSNNIGSPTTPSSSYNLYTETTFDNQNAQGNSSPYFSNKPIPYVCVNTPYQFNNGAADPDGDSLVTEIINPLENNGNCTDPPTAIPLQMPQAPYPAITIPGNPIQANGTFALSPLTGQMNFTCPVVGPQILSVRTKEYRGGQLIGSILRDVQIQVITPCSAVPPSIGTVGLSGVQLVNGQVQGCAGEQLSFGFDLKSPNKKAIVVGSDNHSASIPAANVTYINQATDSVRGVFTWTPGVNQSGLFTLTVTAKDSTCDPPGIVYPYIFTIPIFIWPAIHASKDTSVCPGDPVQLAVTGGGNFAWSIIAGPAGSLSCTNCQFPVASPYATTSYQVVSNLTAFCNNNKDTVLVTTLPSPDFTPVADITTCPGSSRQMNLQLPNLPNVTYNVQWTPGTYLSSATSGNPTVTPAADMTYKVVIKASNTACKGFDTVIVDVLDGFKILNNDTAICEGEKVQVNITGDSRYNYSWTTNDLSGGTSISNAMISNPLITPTSTGKFTYTLTAKYTDCKDSVASFDIDIQPIPTVKVPDDASMCYGDTMQLNAAVTPAFNYSYDWTPGITLNNSKIINPIFSARNTTTLTLTASTSAGCKGSDDINLTVFQQHFAFLSPDTAICPRDTAQLRLTGNGLKSFYWSPNESINSINSMQPSVWPTNTQAYTLFARDTNGCYDTARLKVRVKPAAVIDLPRSVTLYPGQFYKMQPGGNALYYKWFPAVGLSNANIADPIARPEVNTRYIVKATTESDCSVTDSVDVIVVPDSKIDVPNAFTPGYNQTLRVLHLGEAKLKHFTIFNRWGTKLYETNNIDEGWDGKYNGEPQPGGVYVYTVEAESYTGRKITKQGNVTLIR